VLVEKGRNPVYESLAEKVGRILEMWKDKNRDYESIYIEGARIISEKEKLSKRQKDLRFSEMEYSILLDMEKKIGEDSAIIGDVSELSGKLREHIFENWALQPTAEKKVENEVRRFARRCVKKYGVPVKELDPLYYVLLEDVENYGT